MAALTGISTTVERYEAMQRFNALLESSDDFSADGEFEAGIEAARKLGQEVLQEVRRHQDHAAGFEPDVDALSESIDQFKEELGETNRCQGAIDAHLKRVTEEYDTMRHVTPCSQRSIEKLGKIDGGLQAVVNESFSVIKANNERYVQWMGALQNLLGRMTDQVTFIGTWLTTLEKITAKEGRPLTNSEWYGWASVAVQGDAVESEGEASISDGEVSIASSNGSSSGAGSDVEEASTVLDD